MKLNQKSVSLTEILGLFKWNEIKEPKFDKDFYKYRAKEALNVYLRGGVKRKSYADIIAGICELAYQKDYEMAGKKTKSTVTRKLVTKPGNTSG